jgi:UDP:flavonoid glycosyltransferase YjiC (YdhE family)
MSAKRIALATFGSFGDLHPYLAIARELQRRGFIPVIATIPAYQEKVERAGFEFRLLRSAVIDQPDEHLMRKVLDLRNGARFILKHLMMPALRIAYSDALTAFEGVSLVVIHPLTFAARLAAETKKIPWVTTQLAPMGFLSAYDPPAIPIAPWLAPLRPLGPTFFRPLLALARRSVRSWTMPYERFRRELGLPSAGHPLFAGAHSPALVLAMFSSTLGRPMPDWPPQTAITGFPFYDGEETQLTPDLEAFLNEGDPPIVFTLGTSAVLDAGAFYAQSARAATLLAKRAVLLVGSEPKNIPADLPRTVLAAPYARFSLLFPRCAAIVHQGGVGTTAQAMRSGRPMLVMPYAIDQPDNAERVCRLGVARVLTRKAFSAEAARRELQTLLDDPAYRQRGAKIAEAIAKEDGAVAACDRLQACL